MNNQNFYNHLVWRSFIDHPAMKDKRLSVLAKNKVKYITWTVHLPRSKRGITFVDAFLHFHTSLASMAELLSPEDLIATRCAFPDPVMRASVRQKMVHPYCYFSDHRRYAETCLPPRSEFYNTLKQCVVSEEEYVSAQTDCVLLADLWGAYRRETFSTFGLEVSSFVSSATQFESQFFLPRAANEFDIGATVFQSAGPAERRRRHPPRRRREAMPAMLPPGLFGGAGRRRRRRHRRPRQGGPLAPGLQHLGAFPGFRIG